MLIQRLLAFRVINHTITTNTIISANISYLTDKVFGNMVVSLKVCNSSFFSLYFHCFFILFFPTFELIYSPAICRLCFLHGHGCQ